jgi:hypothetical protein
MTSWQGETVWILGHGPSIKTFDFGRLYNTRVISVNGSGVFSARARTPRVCLFSLDNNWIRYNRTFLSTFRGEKYVALPLGSWRDCEGIPDVIYFDWTHTDGLSNDPACISAYGGNSGYGALGLAYLKRPKQINLIGFDMDPKDNPEHFYRAKAFDTTVFQLKAAGIEVVNRNVDSFIDAFPKQR